MYRNVHSFLSYVGLKEVLEIACFVVKWGYCLWLNDKGQNYLLLYSFFVVIF